MPPNFSFFQDLPGDGLKDMASRSDTGFFLATGSILHNKDH
ncbi:MAG: hypothetical protein NVSMB36_25620 [Escherichia coli]